MHTAHVNINKPSLTVSCRFMLPYAGTPEFFIREEQRNATLRATNQTPSTVWQYVVPPQLLELYGTFTSNSVIRQSEPNILRTACINCGLSSGQTLPGLRDILPTETRDSSRGLLSSTYALSSSCENRYNDTMCHNPSGLQPLFALNLEHSPLDPHDSLHDRRETTNRLLRVDGPPCLTPQ
jgi:hypothetical protein